MNLLVDLFDWLITTKRSGSNLFVKTEDYDEFASLCLRRDHLSVCTEYTFFRNATREALSAEGRRRSPWLHVVYCCLRALARDFGQSMSCSREEFRELVREFRINGGNPGVDPDHLLSTAISANFLEIEDDLVRPKIRLLARLASVASPAVTA